MLIYALIVFSVGASAGLALAAAYILRKRLAPWPLSLLHAALGATGLLLLVDAAFTSGISNGPLVALVILAIAALGGFYLASVHFRGEVAKRPIVFLHAGIAVLGFLTLFGAVLGMY
ncbi:MAG TPA: hypothetical protein VKP67_16605 [Xanthobacteraceae bacterium]|nr:hypothetical protein [Xanthobacteraceae bacterium]